MKNLVMTIVRAYAAVAAYTVALLAVIAVVLFATGALTAERVKEAARVLRAPKEKAGARTPVPSNEERRDLRTLELREQALGKLETRLAAELALARQEQEDLARARRKLLEEQEQLKKEKDAQAAAQSDAELAANVPILARMDGAGIVALMKGWDDARFVRYLRALRPAKAAEALEAVRTDPQFEQEFRRLPEEAPPGAKTRADRLLEEFKKAP